MEQQSAAAAGWASHGAQLSTISGGIQGCPPGLEYLTQVDQLLIQQKIELFEILTGFETANKYAIVNSLGQNVFYAAEDSNCLARQCLGPGRPFDMKILDNNKEEVLSVSRPLRCGCFICFCCLQRLDICDRNGQVLGSVEQGIYVLKPEFRILDADGAVRFRIHGPWCPMSCCGSDVNFGIYEEGSGQKVGKITKQWSGLLKEMFTDAENFGVSFPMNLDPKLKAVLLGAVFLIDFMFFERNN